MPSAISQDLRRRIVDTYENGEGSYKEIAERFNVGEASVSRFIRMNRFGGDLTPQKAGGDRHSTALPSDLVEFIVGLVRDEPNWTTQELAEEVNEGYGLTLSRRQIGRLLRGNGFSFKRGSTGHEHLPNQPLSKNESPTSLSRRIWTPPSSCSSTKRAS